jgi:DNA-binding SARP family transcriptional activator/ABC-type branched-subunit amino acid transport system substrate-binding protein/streptogramin lyase
MQIGILGSVEVIVDGRPVPLGGGRKRALLALLALERGRPVPVEQIIDALWDENPPATANKVVQNLVAQLRRSAGDPNVVATQGHAYQLVTNGDDLDAVRFERLLEAGRASLDEGDASRAVEELREALGLWRGPALDGLAGEPWARADAARLEEERETAFEELIDAELALGHHADVLADLEAAVARNPLREGLRARLMLALYRSGRQADALAAFRDARAVLVSELGIEPGPELRGVEEAILRQDPELAGPARARLSPAAVARRRGTVLIIVGGLLLVAGAVLAILIATGGDDGGGRSGALAVPDDAGRLVAVDVASGAVERTIVAGDTPSSIVVRGGAAWFVDQEARTLVRVDTTTGRLQTSSTGATPIDIALAADRVWVLDGAPRAEAAALGPVARDVVALDPETSRRRASITLPAGREGLAVTSEGSLVAAGDALLAVTATESVVRIDANTGVLARTGGVRANRLAAGPGGVWASGDEALLRLDPRTLRVRRRVRLPSEIDVLAVADRAVFAASSSAGLLWRITPGESSVPVSAAVGAGTADMVATAGAVWLANATAGTLTRVDARTMDVTRVVRLGGAPRSLAVEGDRVWVAVSGSGRAAESRVVGIEAVDSGTCAAPIAGEGGRADLLIVSDLPLQGDTRLSALQMEQAITFTLRERGFRAGRFRVAYQSCDDALPGTGFADDARCAANGRAFARTPDVIGVVGSFHSGCAVFIIPPLNRAKGGPVPMVSPLNSYVGLTRAPPDIDEPDILQRMYPTGRRNFARVYPADDVQAGALAQAARDRGARRVFLLEDDYAGYSDLIANAFEVAAGKLGLDVIARQKWNKRTRFAGLARRVAAADPDAVMVSGFLMNGAPDLIRRLRRALGPEVLLMGPDSLAAPYELRQAAGPAANGVLISLAGVTTRRLPPAGARWVQRFRRTQPGVDVESFAVHAAQATEVLLDAISRSDGTRASVLREVFATRLDDSLTGPIAFDAAGDLERAPETIVRVANTDRGTSIASIRGAEVERVIRVPTSLVERTR